MNALSQISIGAGALCYAGFLVFFLKQEIPKCIKERDAIGLLLLGMLVSASFVMVGMFLEDHS